MRHCRTISSAADALTGRYISALLIQAGVKSTDNLRDTSRTLSLLVKAVDALLDAVEFDAAETALSAAAIVRIRHLLCQRVHQERTHSTSPTLSERRRRAPAVTALALRSLASTLRGLAWCAQSQSDCFD